MIVEIEQTSQKDQFTRIVMEIKEKDGAYG